MATSQVICVLWLSILLSTGVSAQDLQSYQGSYSLNDSIEGRAAFQYYLAEGDTLKQGVFLFQSTPQPGDDENLSESKRISGQYLKGQKNGNWTYSSKLLKKDVNPSFDEYELVYKTSGKEYLVNGNFKDGKAQGNWRFLLQKIENSKSVDTLFFAQTNFKEGVISGSFNAYNDSMRISGQVDQNGLIDGTWFFAHKGNDKSIAEHRVYENGVFKKHYFTLSGDTLPMKHIGLDTSVGNSDEIWEELQVSSNYFQIIYHTNFGIQNSGKTKLNTDEIHALIENTNLFLKDALFSFSVHGELNIWDLFPGSETLENAKLKVRKFPFSLNEKQSLKELAQLLQSTDEMISSYFSDAQIDVSKNSYEEIAFYYGIMEVYKERISQLKPFVDDYSEPVFEYINRDEILKHIAPEISYPNTVDYYFKGALKSREHNFPERLKKEDLSAIRDHVKAIRKDLVEIDKESTKILGKYKKESLLADKEKTLVQLKDSIIDLYNKSETDEDFNIYHKLISGKVKGYVQNEFETYASLELEEKVNTISDVTACFDEMVQNYYAIKTLPKKLDDLDDAYTRIVWNPYTYTDMEERIKERLYKAFENDLFPYFLEEISKSINCTEIGQNMDFFDLLYDKMLELREQDTKNIERQLRRTGSIEEIMQILSIQNRSN